MDGRCRPSGNYRSSRPARGRYVLRRNRSGGLGRGCARWKFGQFGRQRRLFLCDISPTKVALTPSDDVYIDNYGFRLSCFEPEACVVRAEAVPYNAVQMLRGWAFWPLSPRRRLSMPWKNQGGGPWGSGPKGPWGSGPQSVGPRPPDLEDLLRRGQDRLQQLLPGGYFSGIGIALLLVGALAIWGLSGFYRVQSEELGVVLRFGKYVLDPQHRHDADRRSGAAWQDDARRAGRKPDAHRRREYRRRRFHRAVADQAEGRRRLSLQHPEPRRHRESGRRKRDARSRRPLQHPADPHRRPYHQRGRGAGTDAEDARQLRLGHPGAAGADAEGRSAGAGDRFVSRRAGGPGRPSTAAERGADLCQ